MQNHKLDLEAIFAGSCIKHMLPKQQLFGLINVPGSDRITIDIEKQCKDRQPLIDDQDISTLNKDLLTKLKDELMTYNQNAIKFEHFDIKQDQSFDKTTLGLSEVAEFLFPNELLPQEKIHVVKHDSNKRKREESETFEVKKVVIKSKPKRVFKDSYDYNYKVLDDSSDIATEIQNELVKILDDIDNADSSVINQLLYFSDTLMKKEIMNDDIKEILGKIIDSLKQSVYDITMSNIMLLTVKVLILTTNKLLNFELLDKIFVFIAEFSQDIETEEDIENVMKFSEILKNLETLLTPALVIDSWDLNRIILSLQYILDHGNNNYNVNSPKMNKVIHKIKISTTGILRMIFGKHPLQRDLILDLIMISFDKIPNIKEEAKFVCWDNTTITYFTYNIFQMLGSVASTLDFGESLANVLEKSKLQEMEMLSYGAILTDLIMEKVIANTSFKTKLLVYSKDLAKSIECEDNIIADYLLSALINKMINSMDSMGNVSLLVLSELGNFIIKGKDKMKKNEYFDNILNSSSLKEELEQFKTADKNYLFKKYSFIDDLRTYMTHNNYKEFNKSIYNGVEVLINAEFKCDMIKHDNTSTLSINHLNSLSYYEIYIKVLLDTLDNQKLQLGAIKNFNILINQNKGLIKTNFIRNIILKILQEDKVVIKEVILTFIKQHIRYIELFLPQVEANVLDDSINIRKAVLAINKFIFEQSADEKLKFYGLKGIFLLTEDENEAIKNDVRSYLYQNFFEPFLDDNDEDLLKLLIVLTNDNASIVSHFSNIMKQNDLIKMFKNINHQLIFSIIVSNQDEDDKKLIENTRFLLNLLKYHKNIIKKSDLTLLMPFIDVNNTDLKLRKNIIDIFSNNVGMIQTDVKIKNELNTMLLNNVLRYQLNELDSLIIVVVNINNRDALVKLYKSLIVTLNTTDNVRKLQKLIVLIVTFIIHSNNTINNNAITNKLIEIFKSSNDTLLKIIVITQLLRLCNKNTELYANPLVLSLLDNKLYLKSDSIVLKKLIIDGLTDCMKGQEMSNNDIVMNLVVKYTPRVLALVLHDDENLNSHIFRYIQNLAYFKIVNPATYMYFMLPLVVYDQFDLASLELDFNNINVINKGTRLMLQVFDKKKDIENKKNYEFVKNLLALNVEATPILQVFIKILKENYNKKNEVIFLAFNILNIVHLFSKDVIDQLVKVTDILLEKLEQEEVDVLDSSYRVLKIFLRHLNFQANNLNYVNFKLEDYDFEDLK